MSGYIQETRKECMGNEHGYIYALVKLNDDDTDSYAVSYQMDRNDFYLTESSVVYIGMTNNPIARFLAHRTEKDKKIGMVCFNKAEGPAEAKMLEANAIYNYCKVKGKGPKFQKGHDTWAGA